MLASLTQVGEKRFGHGAHLSLKGPAPLSPWRTPPILLIIGNGQYTLGGGAQDSSCSVQGGTEAGRPAQSHDRHGKDRLVTTQSMSRWHSAAAQRHDRAACPLEGEVEGVVVVRGGCAVERR